MRLKRYAVVVMDNWTPMHTFWTLRGAQKFAADFGDAMRVYEWRDDAWLLVGSKLALG